MFKSGKKSKKQNLEKEYSTIMKSYTENFFINPNGFPEWKNREDFFVKFSLYTQTSETTTSTDTTATVNF